MTDNKPRIASLQPVVLADKRLVTLEMVVEGLPHLIESAECHVTPLADRKPSHMRLRPRRRRLIYQEL